MRRGLKRNFKIKFIGRDKTGKYTNRGEYNRPINVAMYIKVEARYEGVQLGVLVLNLIRLNIGKELLIILPLRLLCTVIYYITSTKFGTEWLKFGANLLTLISNLFGGFCLYRVLVV